MKNKYGSEAQNMGKGEKMGREMRVEMQAPGPMVIRRDRAGVLQDLGSEADRVGAMLADATPPIAMQAAPVAPARGPMRLVDNLDLLPGGLQRRAGAHWVAMDALSVMCRRAYERHQASGTDAPFVPPFTPGQIAVALDYQAIVEWREGSPIKCASLEAGRAGGGGSGLFIETYINQGEWLAELRHRIGTGQAMTLRRIRPSKRGSRSSITDRALVDSVCVAGETLSDVLRRHGWVKSTAHLEALRSSLAKALDRMQGYRGERHTR